MPTAHKPAIVLFRRDLRLGDNRALQAAIDERRPLIALFVHDECGPLARPSGGAVRWWLSQSLAALSASLGRYGGKLFVRAGETGAIVRAAMQASGADAVFWNRRYDAHGVAIDSALKADLRARGYTAESFDGALLHEPARLRTGQGGPYKVYTPFLKALDAAPEPRDPLENPFAAQAPVTFWPGDIGGHDAAPFWPPAGEPDWSAGLAATWTPGESGAHARLAAFCEEALAGYADGRDIPGVEGVSRLAPHLAFGEITPFQVLAALRRQPAGEGARVFRKELIWREFCAHQLFHQPDLATRNVRPEYDAIVWREDEPALRAWRKGATGLPIVDAGMRQLWRTGWMHNRVRMIVASFLVKHLGMDWRAGEAWFHDTLVDFDPASNPANWQWVAGTGADAAPWFRIFNPVLQGEKFDPHGAYVRAFVPELRSVPDRWIQRPWMAPQGVMEAAGVRIGVDYPAPLVDLRAGRQRALAMYGAARGTPAEAEDLFSL